MAIVPVAKFGDFQAEYEGSIPFTRSNVSFRCLLWQVVDPRRAAGRGYAQVD
jgi:hypothetical protein